MATSQHAEAAKEIRKELKQAFPRIKFKINSDSFSGGNAVRIGWENGPCADQVRKIADKHQYGHFDGMQDIYEYSNKRSDIHQVKYVQYTRHISDDIQQIAFNYMKEHFAQGDKLTTLDAYCREFIAAHVLDAREIIWRRLQDKDLTDGFCTDMLTDI